MYLLIGPIQQVFYVMNRKCKHVSNTYIQIPVHESEITTQSVLKLVRCDFFSFHFVLDRLISMPSVAQNPEKM